MFYCEKCRKELAWPEGFAKSFGPCEVCGTSTECNDVASWLLPLPKPKPPKRKRR